MCLCDSIGKMIHLHTGLPLFRGFFGFVLLFFFSLSGYYIHFHLPLQLK